MRSKSSLHIFMSIFDLFLFSLYRAVLRITLVRARPTRCAIDRSFLGRFRYSLYLKLNMLSASNSLASIKEPARRSKEAESLRRDGIVISDLARIFRSNTYLFSLVKEEFEKSVINGGGCNRLKADDSSHTAKAYTVELGLFDDMSKAHNPLLKLANDESLGDLLESYFEFKPKLYHHATYLNCPYSSQPQHSQLWHRDPEDFKVVKVFIYLTDVDESSGPFIYVPGSQPRGRYSHLTPPSRHPWRLQDHEVESVFPKEYWTLCSGAAGTVIVADTVGLHKGGFTISGYRGVAVFTYTSSTPFQPYK